MLNTLALNSIEVPVAAKSISGVASMAACLSNVIRGDQVPNICPEITSSTEIIIRLT